MVSQAHIKAEEARRDRNTDPRVRWNAILQSIEFAAAQQPVKRNSKKACLERQSILNRSFRHENE